MACPGVGPCQVYDLDLSCCLVSGSIPNPCLTDGTPIPQPLIDSAILTASQFLWAVTGRQFGCCTVPIRPCRACRDECCLPDGGFGFGSYGGGYPFFPVHQADGTWINVSCNCQDQCSCTNLCEIPLPFPVCSVDQVTIDGVVVDPSTYRVDDFKTLVRLNPAPPASGINCWPTCNDLTQPPTEVGTWEVVVTYGLPVPELVKRAASQFACELLKECLGRPCSLPRNVTAVTRQGVTELFANPNEFLTNGYTGLYLVDLAIRTYNPRMLQRRSTVYSPDSANKWRRSTWENGDPIGPGCS